MYGGLPDAQRRAERRARFIQAGIVAFGRDGYAGTTTRSLCAEAGLTQRYFYESFESLEAFFQVVARDLGEDLEKKLLDAVAHAGGTSEVRLHGVLTAYFEAIRKDANAARILLAEVYTAGSKTGALAFRFSAHFAEILRAQIDEEFPDGLGRDVSSALMATGFIGATHHIALKWMMGKFREPLRTVVETALHIYLGSPETRKRRAKRG